MLDDLKLIHRRDPQDALGIAEKQWQQLEQEFTLPESFLPEHIANVVLAGMGGSALAALLVKSWPGLNLPFEIVRDYEIPAYVGANTLFIASSYSGNTEETLQALAEAEARGAQIVVMAAGGKLVDTTHEKGYPLLLIPAGLQPRYSIWYGMRALVTLFDRCGLTQALGQLIARKDWLREQIQGWLPTVATKDNLAKQIAQELMGKSVVVYAGPKLAPAAYKWKISMNENAKHIAWWNQYSELNHNEFLGWTKQPEQKPYAVVELRSNLEHPRIQKRFVVTEKLLSGLRPAPIVVDAVGDSLLAQLLSSVALGDFVSIYLAILSNINPTPVELIERFKKELDA